MLFLQVNAAAVSLRPVTFGPKVQLLYYTQITKYDWVGEERVVSGSL
jgi:hypothetical protein